MEFSKSLVRQNQLKQKLEEKKADVAEQESTERMPNRKCWIRRKNYLEV